MISTHQPASLYYFRMERARIAALRHNQSYNAVVTTSNEMRRDLIWWLPRHKGRSMQVTQWDMVIESNASTLGWGASLSNPSTGEMWTPEESACHINYLELLAAFLALKTFATNIEHKTMLLRLDNVTVTAIIAFLNKIGGDSEGHILCHFAIWHCKSGNGAWRGLYYSTQNTSLGNWM